MKRKLAIAWELTTATFNEWVDDKCPRLGAALSYYTIFSLAPMLIIAIAVAGLVFGEEAARGQIVGQLQGLVGVEGGKAIETMLQSVSKPSTGIIATIIGVVTFMLGATTAFAELQDALNTVWEVQPKPGQGVKGMLRGRVLSFGILLGVGFLLLVSLVLSAALTAVTTFMGGFVPAFKFAAHLMNFVLSFGVITVLFAMIYKILPDVKLAWRDVWMGAAVTSLLFSLGKFLIGLYLGAGSVGSAYGAAGSLVVLLVWIYYSAQIMLLGAEFTQVYADRFGSHVEPAENAMYTPEHYARRTAAAEQAEAQASKRAGAAASAAKLADAAAKQAKADAEKASRKQQLRAAPLARKQRPQRA